MPTTNARKKTLRRQRLIARLVLLFCVGIIVTWMGIIAAHPFLMAQQMRRENDKVETRVLSYKHQIQGYERDLQAWDTPTGFEQIARRYGFVKQGEQRLRIVPH